MLCLEDLEQSFWFNATILEMKFPALNYFNFMHIENWKVILIALRKNILALFCPKEISCS